MVLPTSSHEKDSEYFLYDSQQKTIGKHKLYMVWSLDTGDYLNSGTVIAEQRSYGTGYITCLSIAVYVSFHLMSSLFKLKIYILFCLGIFTLVGHSFQCNWVPVRLVSAIGNFFYNMHVYNIYIDPLYIMIILIVSERNISLLFNSGCLLLWQRNEPPMVILSSKQA